MPRPRVAGRACSYSKRRNNRTTIVRPATGHASSIALFCEPARLYGYGFCRSGLCPRQEVRCVPRPRVAGRACSYSNRRNNRTTVVRPAIGHASIALFCEPARLYGCAFCRSGLCPRQEVRCVPRSRVAGRACSYSKRWNNRTTIVRPAIGHASIALFSEPARLYGCAFCRSGLCPRTEVRRAPRPRVAGRACSYSNRRNNRTTIVRPAIGHASIALFCEPARLYGYGFCRSGLCPRPLGRCAPRSWVAGRACSYSERGGGRISCLPAVQGFWARLR